MPRVSWSRRIIDEARARGLYLGKVELNGYYTDEDPIGGSQISASFKMEAPEAPFVLLAFLQLYTLGPGAQLPPGELRQQLLRSVDTFREKLEKMPISLR